MAESKGLGDDLEKAFEAIGVQHMINRLAKKKGCNGCKKRKKWLNDKVPYKK